MRHTCAGFSACPMQSPGANTCRSRTLHGLTSLTSNCSVLHWRRGAAGQGRAVRCAMSLPLGSLILSAASWHVLSQLRICTGLAQSSAFRKSMCYCGACFWRKELGFDLQAPDVKDVPVTPAPAPTPLPPPTALKSVPAIPAPPPTPPPPPPLAVSPVAPARPTMEAPKARKAAIGNADDVGRR